MRKKHFLLLVMINAVIANAQTTTTIFSDSFDGPKMRGDLWHIPTWRSSSDGTYVGRTQFRCSQNSGLPSVSNGEANVNLDTYNPTGYSFYGTDLITNRSFSMGKGLIFTIRAKFKSPAPRGIVGGIFLYDIVGVPPYHDEIDFELVSNRPTEVQTNIYDNEPLGAGHPGFSPLTGSVTEYHNYVIKWFHDEISWLVDGNTVRSITTMIPDRAMHFHLNIWAPAAGWAEAYDGNLQPVSSAALNTTYTMLVDYVKVDSVVIINSVSEIDRNEPKISFYPNPAHDLIYFDTPCNVSLNIYNIYGDLVLSKHDITDGVLSITDLVPGIYFIHYMQNGICRYSKLIKY